MEAAAAINAVSREADMSNRCYGKTRDNFTFSQMIRKQKSVQELVNYTPTDMCAFLDSIKCVCILLQQLRHNALLQACATNSFFFTVLS